MQPIAAQQNIEILIKELQKVQYLRPTNNGNNEIYIFDGNTSPILMQEIGRLREISFRDAGGGTGKTLDIDQYDTGEQCYKQLIVWNPRDKSIIGGYRYILCKDALQSNGHYRLSTEEIFIYSEELKQNYFPYTIELGRSWVLPQYQPRPGNRGGLFSLDNLWDGLGALIVQHADMKYYFGKITMYKTYNSIARDHLLAFMHHLFPDKQQLLSTHNSLKIETDCSYFLREIEGLNFKDAHAKLNQKIRDLGENIPPLFNSYMNLSPSMKTFPTSVNEHFGGVEETGIMITIADIYDSKKDRHVNSYINFKEDKQ